jgi:hypothetical protein
MESQNEKARRELSDFFKSTANLQLKRYAIFGSKKETGSLYLARHAERFFAVQAESDFETGVDILEATIDRAQDVLGRARA